MTTGTTGTASITIARPPHDVWAAVADITRMGEWSPECTAGRWAGGADGPAVDASFEGDNALTIAGRTVKRWTTTSTVTACEPGSRFDFVSEGYTTWSYRFEPDGAGTRVTETFTYQPKGFMGFVADRILRRPKMLTKGMHRTLQRVKETLEG
jgi:uncharacterized protein YndB with AHSA1/START domain